MKHSSFSEHSFYFYSAYIFWWCFWIGNCICSMCSNMFLSGYIMLIIVTVLIIWHTRHMCTSFHTSGSMSLGLTCGVLAPDVSSWCWRKHMFQLCPCVCVCFYTFSKNLCLSYLIAFVFSFPVLCGFPFFHLLLSFWQPVISPPSVFSVIFVHKQGLCAFMCPDQCFNFYLCWFEFHYYFKRNRNICQLSKQCIAQKGLWEIHLNIQ